MYFDEICPNVRHAGIQRCNKRCKTPERRIYDHEFILPVNGDISLNLDDKTYVFEENAIILIKPNIPHFFSWDCNNEGHYLWVHFDFKYLNDAEDINYKNNDFHNTLFHPHLPWKRLIRNDPVFENGFVFPEYMRYEDNPAFKNAFLRIVRSYEKQEMFWQLECRHLMIYLLHLYLKECFKVSPFFNYTDKISDALKEYVNKNIRSKLSIKNVARVFGYSDEYLGKLFITQTGESFSSYVNKARVRKAIELMKSSELPLSNISELCGFCDAFYLSRVTKKYTGKSPLQIRESPCFPDIKDFGI